jgi:hypothetical protein
MNADKHLVFNLRSSAFIGGQRFVNGIVRPPREQGSDPGV